MNTLASSVIRRLIPKQIRTTVNHYHSLALAVKPLFRRRCPVCGFEGYFTHFGRPPRLDACCPNCGSLERHRLFWLWFKEAQPKFVEPVLHFAAEPIVEERLRLICQVYETADLFNDRADIKLNIEQIDKEDQSVGTVICNHVLEHVDDVSALKEIHRILKDDGLLIASVPIVEGWERSYENPSIQDPALRDLHFGQFDHVRFYGRDFRDRLNAAGFDFEEITAEGEAVIKYSLLRGEKFFLCKKNKPGRPA